MIASETLVDESLSTRHFVHSLAIVKVTVFLVAIGKVVVLEVVVVKVASTSIAIIIVATALEVVNVKIAPVLEGVVVEVEVFSKVVS